MAHWRSLALFYGWLGGQRLLDHRSRLLKLCLILDSIFILDRGRLGDLLRDWRCLDSGDWLGCSLAGGPGSIVVCTELCSCIGIRLELLLLFHFFYFLKLGNTFELELGLL